jgi:hypothetical protein
VLPAIVPRLFVALRLGVAIALVVAVTVEIAANPHGMGYALMIAQQSLDPALMMAWLCWIGVIGYTVNALAHPAPATWPSKFAWEPSMNDPRQWGESPVAGMLLAAHAGPVVGGEPRAMGEQGVSAHARVGLASLLEGLQQGELFKPSRCAPSGACCSAGAWPVRLGVAWGALHRHVGHSERLDAAHARIHAPAARVGRDAAGHLHLWPVGGMVLAVVAFGAMWPVLLATAARLCPCACAV